MFQNFCFFTLTPSHPHTLIAGWCGRRYPLVYRPTLESLVHDFPREPGTTYNTRTLDYG